MDHVVIRPAALVYGLAVAILVVCAFLVATW